MAGIIILDDAEFQPRDQSFTSTMLSKPYMGFDFHINPSSSLLLDPSPLQLLSLSSVEGLEDEFEEKKSIFPSNVGSKLKLLYLESS